MFSENPTVRDFVFDHVASLDVQGIEGGDLPRDSHEVLLEGPLRASHALMRSSSHSGKSFWK